MRAEQRWYAGGAIGALLILLISYFFVISPENADGDSLNSQTASVLTQNIATRNRLNKLQVENGKLNQYKATLSQQQLALPPTENLTDYIRYLQSNGVAAGVLINSISVGATTAAGSAGGTSTGTSTSTTTGSSTGAATSAGAGTAAAATAGGATSITITVTAVGSGDQLQSFLDQIQNQSARAALITSASIKATNGAADGTIAGLDALVVTMQVFVSPSPTAQAEGS